MVNEDLMTVHPLAKKSQGGTELMQKRLYEDLPRDLLKKFQIIFSRVDAPLDNKKIRIYYCHDLPNDPASAHLAKDGWKKFHKLVFVSNSQMQQYVGAFNIPWSRCSVMQNAIIPIEKHEKSKDIVKLGYWSTPQRGLGLLVPVFEKLAEKYSNVELDVYSSFEIYGWPEKDKEFEPLFKRCLDHPKINYKKAIPNDQLREKLKDIHILAYPSIWTETSCLVLMEAMSAQLLCVHPNLGSLYETAGNWTFMYQYHEDYNAHASVLYNMLDYLIPAINKVEIQNVIHNQKTYADTFYNWNNRSKQWLTLLESLKDLPTEFEQEMYSYKVN